MHEIEIGNVFSLNYVIVTYTVISCDKKLLRWQMIDIDFDIDYHLCSLLFSKN